VHGLYLLESFLGELKTVKTRYWRTGSDPNLLFDEWRVEVEGAKAPGQMYLSWNVKPMQNEIVVHGTRGVLHVDCYLQTLTARRVIPAPKPVQRIFGALRESASTFIQVSKNTLRFALGRLRSSPGIHVSAQQFHIALRNGQAPPVPPEEGRRMVAWMEEASAQADAEHREITRLPDNLPPAKILVTGANGFLGRKVLARLLEQD
jgi:hypothetical protein